MLHWLNARADALWIGLRMVGAGALLYDMAFRADPGFLGLNPAAALAGGVGLALLTLGMAILALGVLDIVIVVRVS